LKPRGLDKAFGELMPRNIKHYFQFVAKGVVGRLEQEEATEALGEESNRKDMLHYLSHAVDPETGHRGYSQSDLMEESDMLTVAATDTTAATIAAALFYIVRNPLVYSKLRDEIRSTFHSPDDIKLGLQLEGCKCLHAVINETLRMSPAGANEFPREVLDEGIRVEAEYLPRGVNCETTKRPTFLQL
jgi:cytochrome P450